MRVAMSTSNEKVSSSGDEDAELRRGPWTAEEDTLLIHYIALHGDGRWNLLAKSSGLRRTGKSCRLRWLNYLKPDVKRGNLTLEEQLLILELHTKWGNRWSKIAQQLPGRTDNEIKNYWRTRVQKQARHLKIDSNSTAFENLIRCFWMPRLLQKIEASSSAKLSQNTQIPQPQITSGHSSRQPLPLPLPQAHPRGPPDARETKHSFDHRGKNSSSENCTSPSICSSESMNISQIPEVSEYPTSPFHAMTAIDHYNTVLKDSRCDLDQYFNFASTSALGYLENPVNSHMVESSWVENSLGDSLWNMTEL